MGDATYFIADKTYDLLKNETIRSQCLVMISSLIEVFGDDAINALLLVLQRMFAADLINKEEEIKVKELVEENKSEGSDQEEEKEAKEFKELLEELAYVSNHPKDQWKRREIAIVISGVFMEDISMYMIRHPMFDA